MQRPAVFASILWWCCLPLLVGCHSHKRRASVGTTPAPPPLTIRIEQDRANGALDTQFRFVVHRPGPDAVIDQVEWDLGDGRTSAQPSPSVTYAKPGTYIIRATATDASGRSASDSTTITVFGPPGTNTVGPGGIPMAKVVGDVDGDGQLTTVDAQKILRHIRGFARFTDADQRLAADLDLDGSIDEFDARLALEAAVVGRELPDRLLLNHGTGGTFVNLISPHLRRPETKVTLEIAGVAIDRVHRPALGYANFFIPLAPTPPAAGATEIQLKLDGVVVAKYPFVVDPATVVPPQPMADLQRALALSAKLRARLPGLLDRLLRLIQATPEQAATLRAMLRVGEQELASKGRDLADALGKLPAEVQTLMRQAADANGFADALASVEQLSNGGAAAARLAGEDWLPLLCEFNRIRTAGSRVNAAIEKACDYALVAVVVCALVPSFAQPACAAAILPVVSFCAGAAIPGALIEAVGDFVPGVPSKLIVTATPPAKLPGPIAITVELPVIGMGKLCGKAAGKLEDWIAKKVRIALLRRSPGLRQLSRLLQKLSRKDKNSVFKRLLDAIENTITSALKTAISGSQIERWLREVADRVCDSLDAGLPLAPSLCNLKLSPDVGTLRFGGPNAKTAFYDCDPNSNEPSVQLTASRSVCGRSAVGEAQLVCAGVDVKFTIGDNGSLLDDIFELKVNGRTELTSSRPVRSISKTLFLVAGEHEVQMIGRAAPDNIGTYFLRIEGAKVKSGPPLSGSNLTVNRVFTWKIEVQ